MLHDPRRPSFLGRAGSSAPLKALLFCAFGGAVVGRRVVEQSCHDFNTLVGGGGSRAIVDVTKSWRLLQMMSFSFEDLDIEKFKKSELTEGWLQGVFKLPALTLELVYLLRPTHSLCRMNDKCLKTKDHDTA